MEVLLSLSVLVLMLRRSRSKMPPPPPTLDVTVFVLAVVDELKAVEVAAVLVWREVFSPRLLEMDSRLSGVIPVFEELSWRRVVDLVVFVAPVLVLLSFLCAKARSAAVDMLELSKRRGVLDPILVKVVLTVGFKSSSSCSVAPTVVTKLRARKPVPMNLEPL